MQEWTKHVMQWLFVCLGMLSLPVRAQERVVSLDYCADQYVMALAEREHIRAVSPAASSEYSYLAPRSAGLPQLRPSGEEVLLAEPDVVVRQWGGGFETSSYLKRFGIKVVQVSFGSDIQSARVNLRSIGAALGEPEKAEQLVRDMDLRLARVQAQLRPRAQRPRAIYVTPGGLSTGAGTIVHDVMRAAGVVNMGAEGGRRGWQETNLEAIALDPPDLIVGAFFDLKANDVSYWSIARHSFLREVMAETPTVLLAGAQVACSAWFFVDAVEAIHEKARHLDRTEAVN